MLITLGMAMAESTAIKAMMVKSSRREKPFDGVIKELVPNPLNCV
jgi:hypothetical protein